MVMSATAFAGAGLERLSSVQSIVMKLPPASSQEGCPRSEAGRGSIPSSINEEHRLRIIPSLTFMIAADGVGSSDISLMCSGIVVVPAVMGLTRLSKP